MLKLATLLLLVVPAVASADVELDGTAATSHDCGADPVLNIIGAGTFTVTGACKQVNLNAGKATVTVADVEELNINGADNKVTAGAVGAVNINGAKNKVTWKQAKKGKKPAVSSNGKGNGVAKAK